MPVNDPIADLLARIRNAGIIRAKEITLPSSKLLAEVARVLRETGYIADFETRPDNKQGLLSLKLKYDRKGDPIIREMKRISRPGRRVYRGAGEIRPVKNELGVAIVSTPKGVMTDGDARRLGVGGEVLCTVF